MSAPAHARVEGTAQATAGEAPGFSPGYRAYALALLVVVYIFNFIDRQILSIVAPLIQKEFAFNDAWLGMLTGPVFALFYTFVGIPIARWADVGVRRSIIALALLIWSGMTALTGFAQSFLHLALARIGVGVGEAGCSPPAHSLISDLFPLERRGTALAIYSLGIPIGGAIGTALGGWLGQTYGWRTAFLALGIPGVLLALIVRFTLREPPRTQAAPARRESIPDVFRFMLGLPSFRFLCAGASLHAFYGYGAAGFIPVFLIRVHGMTVAEVGAWLGAIALITGTLGTFLGGAIGDRLSGKDARWYMRVPAIASLIGVPFTFLFYLWPDARTAILLSVPAAVLGPFYLGPTFAMTQSLAKPHMRAVASSVLLFIINLIGLGAGPVFVGVLSDFLKPAYGTDAVRYALLWTVAGGGALSAVFYLLAARTLREDLLRKDAA
jgi:MFS family permease